MKLEIRDNDKADLICHLEYNEMSIDFVCETSAGERFTLLSLLPDKTYMFWTGDMDELGFTEA